jgi:hypothetical protein
MWAYLDNLNKVKSVIHPDCSQTQLNEYQKTGTLIEMTLENSPAWIEGYYKNGKFYPPSELDVTNA